MCVASASAPPGNADALELRRRLEERLGLESPRHPDPRGREQRDASLAVDHEERDANVSGLVVLGPRDHRDVVSRRAPELLERLAVAGSRPPSRRRPRTHRTRSRSRHAAASSAIAGRIRVQSRHGLRWTGTGEAGPVSAGPAAVSRGPASGRPARSMGATLPNHAASRARLTRSRISFGFMATSSLRSGFPGAPQRRSGTGARTRGRLHDEPRGLRVQPTPLPGG